MKNKYVKSLIVIAIILVLCLVTTASYAFFTANVKGNNGVSNSVITTGRMEVTYTDGNVIGSTEKIMPGDSIEKHFSVTNTGTVETAYDIYLNDVINTFNIKSDLVYELISENGANISETTCPDTNAKIASSNIGVGLTHDYTLKITYKNVDRNQDDNKGKGFRFKIDLVEKEAQNYLSKVILSNKLSGTTDLEYDGTSILGENGTSDNNLRYVGANPDNYIYFNCSTTNVDEMNDTTCEKWRIIGFFNNIEDENGNIKSRVKIIRDNSLGNYSMDSSVESVNTGRGINQWGESTYSDGTSYEGADLMRELNTDYLGNITVGTEGYWYKNPNNQTVSMPTTTLNQNAQSMIETVKWNLGVPSNNEGAIDTNWTSNMIPSTSYTRERADTNGKLCLGDTACTDTVNRISTWTGKVAFLYPSDYGYATSGGSTTSRATCLNTSMNSWSESEVSDCKNNNWILSSTGQWTLSPHASSTFANYVFIVNNEGKVDLSNVSAARAVYPVLFLKSNIIIDSGNGSESNPYKLTM